MINPPDKIYLQFHGDGDPEDLSYVRAEDVTWAQDRVFDSDVEYTRSHPAAASVDVVERVVKRLRDMGYKGEVIGKILTEELSTSGDDVLSGKLEIAIDALRQYADPDQWFKNGYTELGSDLARETLEKLK